MLAPQNKYMLSSVMFENGFSEHVSAISSPCNVPVFQMYQNQTENKMKAPLS